MNKFCFGQVVIDVLTRKSHIVSELRGNGVIVVDTNREAHESNFRVLVEYLDPTNFLYHHSKFAQGCTMVDEAFSRYMMALEDLQELSPTDGESVFLMQARALCEATLKDLAGKIEKGLAWKRTAEHNLAQWGGVTLDHHFPFLNPENVTDY